MIKSIIGEVKCGGVKVYASKGLLCGAYMSIYQHWQGENGLVSCTTNNKLGVWWGQ